MATINATWHMANRMPKNATPDERIAWHIAHARHCCCRAPGGKILEEIKKRGLKIWLRV